MPGAGGDRDAGDGECASGAQRPAPARVDAGKRELPGDLALSKSAAPRARALASFIPARTVA